MTTTQRVPINPYVILDQKYRHKQGEKQQGHIASRTMPFFSLFLKTDGGAEEDMVNNNVMEAMQRNRQTTYRCGTNQQLHCRQIDLLNNQIVSSSRLRLFSHNNWAIMILPLTAFLLGVILIVQYLEDVATREFDAPSIRFIEIRLAVLFMLVFVVLFVLTIVYAEYFMLKTSLGWFAAREDNDAQNPYFPNRRFDLFTFVILFIMVLSISLLRPKKVIIIVLSIVLLIIYMVDAWWFRTVGTSWFLATFTMVTMLTIIILTENKRIKGFKSLNIPVFVFIGIVFLYKLFAMYRSRSKKKTTPQTATTNATAT